MHWLSVHTQAYTSVYTLFFFTHVVACYIHCICFFHLVYLGSSLFDQCPIEEHLLPIFCYSSTAAIVIPYLCHSTHMQIYQWDEFLAVVLLILSQGVSTFNFERYCQIDLTEVDPVCTLLCNVQECVFSLSQMIFVILLIFVIFASLCFVLHLSCCEWGWTSFPVIKSHV